MKSFANKKVKIMTFKTLQKAREDMSDKATYLGKTTALTSQQQANGLTSLH